MTIDYTHRSAFTEKWLDWIEQGLTSPPTQYRLSGRKMVAEIKEQNYNKM